MSIYLIKVEPSDGAPAASYYVEADDAEDAQALLRADRALVGETVLRTEQLPVSDAGAVRYAMTWTGGIAEAQHPRPPGS